MHSDQTDARSLDAMVPAFINIVEVVLDETTIPPSHHTPVRKSFERIT
jgi:hypothetical protein